MSYQQARERAALFDVSDRGKLQVTGPDAAAFLHNLCTNDIKNLAVGSGCEAFLATAQARAVAHTLIYRLAAEDFWLDVAPGQVEKVYKHLDHYLISEQVELADRTGEFAQLHVAGPRAADVLRQVVAADLPSLSELQVIVRADGTQVRRHSPLGLPGYDVVFPATRFAELQQALTAAGAAQADPETYNVLRVEAGTPVYGVDIDESRLVMETGRTAQAISYTKGCYLGQEPVVMARDRGHINRTLVGLRLGGDGPAPQGSKLLREGKEVGVISSSVFSPRLGPIALGYVRRGSWEPGTRLEVEGTGRTAEVVALPVGAKPPGESSSLPGS